MGKGYVRQTPVQRLHRGHSSGSSWALTKERHTCADVNAAATRQPGYPIPEKVKQTTEPGGLQEEAGPKGRYVSAGRALISHPLGAVFVR